MIVYCPLYNEMPWTPFILKHLLEYDCKIIISEGASDIIQFDNIRSSDGTFELINIFRDKWKDRVEVIYHNLKDQILPPGEISRSKRYCSLRPRHIARKYAWDQLKNGEILMTLDADNFYRSEDIPRLKSFFNMRENQNKVQFLTSQRVFVFNFNTFIQSGEPGLCGSWFSLWPLNFRKLSGYSLPIGYEYIENDITRKAVVTWKIQSNKKLFINNGLISVDQTIEHFHYKGVKELYTRVKRYGEQNATKFMNYIDTQNKLYSYSGDHPKILDTHPFRYIKDCRIEEDKPKYQWHDFVDMF